MPFTIGSNPCSRATDAASIASNSEFPFQFRAISSIPSCLFTSFLRQRTLYHDAQGIRFVENDCLNPENFCDEFGCQHLQWWSKGMDFPVVQKDDLIGKSGCNVNVVDGDEGDEFRSGFLTTSRIFSMVVI